MAVTSKDMTIKHRTEKFTGFCKAADLLNTAGTITFNSVAYENGATILDTADAINDRWHCAAFDDAVDTACTGTIFLPDNYIAGTDIEVISVWTTTSSTSGNCYWDIGLSQTDGSDIFTDNETYTEYTGQTAVAGPTATNEIIRTSNTFSGADLTPNDAITILHLREGSNASDTLSDQVKLLGFFWKIDIEQR